MDIDWILFKIVLLQVLLLLLQIITNYYKLLQIITNYYYYYYYCKVYNVVIDRLEGNNGGPWCRPGTPGSSHRIRLLLHCRS